jgi:hypothetical protein
VVGRASSIVSPIDNMQPRFCRPTTLQRIVDIYLSEQENPDGSLKRIVLGRTTDSIIEPQTIARNANGGLQAPHRTWDPLGTVVVERVWGRDNVGDVARKRII